MRQIIVTLLVVIGSVAHAQDNWLLSADQISKLTPSEQVHYIKQVRKILTETTQQVEQFSRNEAKRSRKPAADSAATPAQTEDQRIDAIVTLLKDGGQFDNNYNKELGTMNAYDVDPNKLKAFGQRATNAGYWLALEKVLLDQIPPNDPRRTKVQPGNKTSLDARIAADLTLFNTPDFKAKMAKSGASSVYKTLDKVKNGSEDPCASNIIPDNVLYDYNNKTNKIVPQPVKVGGSLCTKKTAAATKPALAAKSTNAKAGAKTKAAAKAKKAFRCIYAGFILQGEKCVGPSKLPDGVTLKVPDASQLDCGNDVLCNPLIYGIKGCDLTSDMKDDDQAACLKKAEPVCVAHSKSATSKCSEDTNTDKSVQTTLQLIKLNPDAWQKFNDDFHGLCTDYSYNDVYANGDQGTKDRITADVQTTCDTATARLKKLGIDTAGTAPAKKAAATKKSTTPADTGNAATPGDN